jgi:hypothetical protein
MSDVIQCMGICYNAQSPSGDITKAESTVEMMRMLIYFRNQMQLAANIMQTHTKSSNETIKTSAEFYNFFYQSMADNQKAVISHFEDMFNNPDKVVAKPGTQAAQFGEITARFEELWAMYNDYSMMAVYSMIDPNRLSEDGKVNRLYLSKDERQELSLKLSSIFGNQIKQGVKVGQKPLISSASLFYSMLNEPKWKSSDAK